MSDGGIADGHVTCNIQCWGGNCDRRMVDVGRDTLPHDLPWSTIGRRLIRKECGAAGSVNMDQDRRRFRAHSGACTPGDESHSSTCVANSASRALRISLSRSGPEGSCSA